LKRDILRKRVKCTCTMHVEKEHIAGFVHPASDVEPLFVAIVLKLESIRCIMKKGRCTCSLHVGKEHIVGLVHPAFLDTFAEQWVESTELQVFGPTRAKK
jgi:hypothetical protein